MQAGEDASAAGTVSDEVKPKAGVGKPVTYPVVSFLLPNGGQRQIMVTPQTWKVELPTGEVTASRTAVSFDTRLGYEYCQTLDRVKVDLGKIFEKGTGQAYVALSRATNLDGLQVMNFRAEKVTAHKTVIEWTKTLEVIKPPSLPSARAESSGNAPTDSGEEMEY
ncbi:hypothetical protein DL96DRAFT_1704753 [Flagelloscypha sp. PMI_526]|nr:hypothetical protein DL96DRAFT_1704753 [Flagelloscypha sp. PMI_526]